MSPTGGVRRTSVVVPLVIAAGVLLLGLFALVYFKGRSFIYYRTDLPEEMLASFASTPGWQLEKLRVGNDVQLFGLVRPSTSTTSTTVLFFGGNASDLGGNQSVLESVWGSERDLGLFVFAYRGYDGSGGEPSEKAIVADAEAIVAHLIETYGASRDRLVIVGQSLGSGVACQLAARLSRANHPPWKLILLSPFLSMSKMFDSVVPIVPIGWAAPDRYDSEAATADIRCPVLIVHGTDDEVVPVTHGRQLAGRLFDRAELVELPLLGHNDLFTSPETIEALRSFVRDGASAAPSGSLVEE